MLPRLPDYIHCFALMAIPAVATTMAIIFLRTATNGVQSSLYIVYLNGVGLTGTSIGILFAAIEVTSGLGSLFVGRAMLLGDPQRTMLTGTVLSILLISVMPFIGAVFALLLAAQALRGWLQGGRSAGHVLGAGQGGRALPARFGRRPSPNDEPAGGNRDTARNGRNRRQMGRRIELSDPRHHFAGTVGAGRADHPPRYAPCRLFHSRRARKMEAR